MEQFRLAEEEQNGVRFSWNVWPDNKADALRLAVPISCLYSVLKPIRTADGKDRVVEYPPVACKNSQCGAFLNPYCQLDIHHKAWVCPFCLSRNTFPHEYADISAQNKPAELQPQCTTIEYILQRTNLCPIFLFVLDTTIPAKEFNGLKESITKTLQLLPENALVGLITFGRNVHVHELRFEECAKSLVIRGTKDVLSAPNKDLDVLLIAKLLGMGANLTPEQRQQHGSRFLVPIAECEDQLTQLLEDLTVDAWPTASDMRAENCAGTAFAVAVALLETIYKGHNARILSFIGSPPTVGAGQVIGLEMKQVMRSHHDLQQSNAPLFADASKFYEKLADRCQSNAHIFDLFSCCFDQTGVCEMRSLVQRTGGVLVLDDSFHYAVFQNSLHKLFTRSADTNESQMCFGSTLQVLTSRELKICGAIGVSSGLEQKSASVSETEIGMGGTCAWVMGGLLPNSTVSVYFEVAAASGDELKDGRQAYIQFITRYRSASGAYRLRVTTVARAFADPRTEQGLGFIKSGFDQEAAAVLTARHAIHKADTEYAVDIVCWLDKHLIRLVSKVANYTKNDANSLKLSREFMLYPIFMFHLRRSHFLQVFNSAPDETVFFRYTLLRENAMNGITMIQPALTSYSTDLQPTPELLDVSAVRPDRIFLLDTFFEVIVYFGQAVAQWRAQKLHLTDDYKYLQTFMDTPANDAKEIVQNRFPHPKYIVCEHGDSQSRFFIAPLNPSVSHHNRGAGGGAVDPVITDDVSANVFMQHLKKLAVSAQ